MDGRYKNHLRDFRIKQLITQKELAELSGVSQVTISFIETGLSVPMNLTKEKLARALKIRVSQLFPEKVAY